MDLNFCDHTHMNQDNGGKPCPCVKNDYEICTLTPLTPANSEVYWAGTIPYWDHLQSPHFSPPLHSKLHKTTTESPSGFNINIDLQDTYPQHRFSLYDDTEKPQLQVTTEKLSAQFLDFPLDSPARSPPETLSLRRIEPAWINYSASESRSSPTPNDARRASDCSNPRLPSERRREQNRVAQQRYRMAKEQKLYAAQNRVRELESELLWSQRIVSEQEEYITRLKIKNDSYRGSS